MRKIDEIASDIRGRLSGSFPTVRYSASETSEQLANEIRAISESRLPAVVIVIAKGEVTDCARTLRVHAQLVLINRFVAGSDERALDAWRSLTLLMELFPPDVTEENGIVYTPLDFYSASADPKYACFAFELEAKQS